MSPRRFPHLPDAEDLIHWADRIEARAEFPRLIRMLITQTNDQVTRCDIRAGAGTGSGGYDGIVHAGRQTPFVPMGPSVWELGTGHDPPSKATSDYGKRTRSPRGVDRATTTFVFATPRRWDTKEEWASKKNRTWREVRVVDADDIEAAFEAAPAASFWFAELIGKPVGGVRPIESWWQRFKTQSAPELTAELVLAGRQDAAGHLLRLLGQETRRTTVSAASPDDVLAFVASTLMTSPDDIRDDLLSRTLIVHDVDALRYLDNSQGLLILLPFDERLHREASLITSHHLVMLNPQGEVSDIVLPPIDADLAREALLSVGVEADEAFDLASSLNRSVVAFLRSAPSGGAMPRVEWSVQARERLVRRAWLAGAWMERRSGDLDALGDLLGSPYEDCVDQLREQAGSADPLISVSGDSWLVHSPEESWAYIGAHLTSADLDRLQPVVQAVLGAIDPALELPVDQRWMAAIYGKTSVYSGELRRGLATTLAVVCWAGGGLSLGAGTTGQTRAEAIIFQLFDRANNDESGHLWSSLSDVLPLLAEAAPDMFLQAIQRGLEGSDPVVMRMFGDAEGEGVLSVSSAHTGLLWALETLAWSADLLGSVVAQLARLAELDPGGRLSNRPMGSLQDIFRSWLPQTTADLTQRMAVVDGLQGQHEATRWDLLLSMLPEKHGVGSYTHKPSYRLWHRDDDGVTYQERWDTGNAVVDRLLAAAEVDASRWVALVERLEDMSPDDRSRAVTQLKEIVEGGVDAASAEAIWIGISEVVRSHRTFSESSWAMPVEDVDDLSELADALAPPDSGSVGHWLFDEHLPDTGFPQLDNHDAYLANLRGLREEVVTAVADGGGLDAVIEFAKSVEFPWLVGQGLGAVRTDGGETVLDLIDSEDERFAAFALGFAGALLEANGSDWLEGTVEDLAGRPRSQARLLLMSIDLDRVWPQLATLGRDVEVAYWGEFSVRGRGTDFGLFKESAAKLIEHGRIGAALDLLHLYTRRDQGSAASAGLIVDALEQFTEMEEPEDYRLLSGYELEALLDVLRANDIDEGRVAMLEWKLRPALGFQAKTPLLEKKLATDPEFFVELVSLCFRPRDREPEREVGEAVARNARQVLDEWSVIPGTSSEEDGLDEVELTAWLDTARARLREVDRIEIGDLQIGEVFARSEVDVDGAWPVVAVRNAIEALQSSAVEDGLRMGIYNSRGVTKWEFFEGGEQELALVEKYSTWAAAVSDRWPRTGGVLRAVADIYRADAQRRDQEAERRRTQGSV